ncbi:hypothetical protein AK830_g6287 [Neonectria ditissima]|uniref:Uncharacterized protein n=1 Tax=Neonectria ditissima TaxID=78410 RepID=A0A0P7BIV6_9HYPO|nr:hypothetical protein AK830_g6287 [Neonectria ditissima]
MKRATLLSVNIGAVEERDQVIQQFHIGISILETEWLESALDPFPDPKSAASMIQSSYYVVGSPDYRISTAEMSIFGKIQPITLADLKEKLEAITAPGNGILVLHDSKRGLSLLERLDIYLNPLFTIDTVKAAQHPLRLSYRYSLAKMLEELEIPFTGTRPE